MGGVRVSGERGGGGGGGGAYKIIDNRVNDLEDSCNYSAKLPASVNPQKSGALKMKQILSEEGTTFSQNCGAAPGAAVLNLLLRFHAV